MDGNLAVFSNGQGLASATIDEMSRLGLYPASVLLLDNNIHLPVFQRHVVCSKMTQASSCPC